MTGGVRGVASPLHAGKQGALRRVAFLLSAIAAFPFVCGLVVVAFSAARWQWAVVWISTATFIVSLVALLRGYRKKRRWWGRVWLAVAAATLVFFARRDEVLQEVAEWIQHDP